MDTRYFRRSKSYLSRHHRINQRKNSVNADIRREINQLKSVKIQNSILRLSGESNRSLVRNLWAMSPRL